MRSTTALALAAATLVSAQGNGTAPGLAGFPAEIGEFFELYGCVNSQNNFPTFVRVSQMPTAMDLDFCAASCDTEYFGVYGSDCYCGDELDGNTASLVDFAACDVPCPGNPEQKCGGFIEIGRRQAQVPDNILLTVYVRRGDEPDTTTTVTSTSTGTITSCPPTATGCVIGLPTVYTATSAYCPQATPDYKRIVCYGDVCESNQCPTCAAHRVVCRNGECYPEECAEEEKNRLVICEGEHCDYASGQKGKVVCYGETCDIQQCTGACQEKIINNKVCTGEQCVRPAPPAITPAPVCFGPECSIVPPTNGTEHLVYGGAGAVLPAAGAVIGLVAGVAALL